MDPRATLGSRHYCYDPHLMGKLRHGEVKKLAQCHPARKWQSQYLNLSSVYARWPPRKGAVVIIVTVLIIACISIGLSMFTKELSETPAVIPEES